MRIRQLTDQTRLPTGVKSNFRYFGNILIQSVRGNSAAICHLILSPRRDEENRDLRYLNNPVRDTAYRDMPT
jgi:hypothetical protein